MKLGLSPSSHNIVPESRRDWGSVFVHPAELFPPSLARSGPLQEPEARRAKERHPLIIPRGTAT